MVPVASVLQRLARLRPYFVNSRPALVAVVLATLLTSLTEPAIPALMKPLLDEGFKGGSFNLWLVPAILLGLFAVRGAAGFVAQYALAHVSTRAMVNLRRRLFERLLQAEPAMFGRSSASALANTVVYEVQTGTNLLVYSLLSLVKDSVTLAALMGYLLYVNWKLTIIVLLVFPGVAIVMKVLSRRLHRITQASQNATDGLAYVVEENVLAHRVVRLHDAGESQGRRFHQLSQELRRLAMKSTVAASAMTPITQMLAATALSAVICTALWQSASSGITVGGFAAFVTAVLMLIAPIKRLSESASPITRGLAALERGLDLLEQTPVEQEGTHEVPRAAGDLRFERVVVRYPGAAHDALRGLDLHIRPGTSVALVGSSGSGKTTVGNLLPRFVEPVAGQILLDGVPLAQWKLAALRRQFSFVSQDVVMFNDTVAANVAVGEEPDRARVLQALEAANLGGFLAGLPAGIDSRVGHNAANLSGGQRQRLAIARAIYKDAPILVLDEATSALDTESERAVQSALQRLMAGRTTLIIAHRLSTIEHADSIVVLDAGRVVEQGTHAQLVQRGGAYARLHSVAQTQADPEVAAT